MGCSSSSSLAAAVVDGTEAPLPNDSPMCFHQNYILGAKLGVGAFGQIHVTTPADISDEETNQLAVKILDVRGDDEEDETTWEVVRSTIAAGSPRNCSAREPRWRRAKREEAVWRAVGSHPNCVSLHAAFHTPELSYMVMEICPLSLLRHLDSFFVNERSLGNIFVQMLRAVAHLHSLQIIHRDVKPDNFLVGGESSGTVKLTDFGLSEWLSKGTKKHTICGTAPFMCPEMVIHRSYDEGADVWSLGVIAYTLLFGSFPYIAKESSSKSMKQAIVEGIHPRFEPVKLMTGPTSHVRTDSAVEFVQALLHRVPEQRPSAEDALKMKYMVDVAENHHAPGQSLPSLQPMVVAARRAGVFETHDLHSAAPIDDLLNNLQMERHGVPLPTYAMTPSNSIHASVSLKGLKRNFGTRGGDASPSTTCPSEMSATSSRVTASSKVNHASTKMTPDSRLITTSRSASPSPRSSSIDIELRL